MLYLSSREEDEDEDEDDRLLDACQKDLRALKEACGSFCDDGSEDDEEPDGSVDEDDDVLLLSIQKRFGTSRLAEQPPLSPSFAEEDDEEILRAVQERFSTSLPNKTNGARDAKGVERCAKTSTGSFSFQESTTKLYNKPSKRPSSFEAPTSFDCNSRVSPARVSEQSGFWQPGQAEDTLDGIGLSLSPDAQPLVKWLPVQPPEQSLLQLPGEAEIFDDTTEGSYNEHIDGLPQQNEGLNDLSEDRQNQSVRCTLDALKKNRLSQKVLLHKLEILKLKLGENKDLKKRVRVLLDFQSVASRKYAFEGEYSTCDSDTTKRHQVPAWPRMKVEEIKCAEWGRCRPPENEDVAKFRAMQKKYCLTFEPKTWTKEEKIELVKGVEQQVQESRIRSVMNLYSAGDNDADFLDEEVRTIAEQSPTPEDIRKALPTIDWNEVARLYVIGRSPTECWIQWSNYEDCLINCGSWTKSEDKKLWSVVKQYKLCNWDLIAQELGSRRSIAQCLIRYQRSLNAGIMRGPWTQTEDEQLRAAVQQFGDHDWLSVAAALEGRTGPQCWNRWHKIINPLRQKSGRWSVNEDKRLRLAVSVYGPRTWKLIAVHVPGRTEVQCRERWCNVLNPCLTLAEWTPEEDQKLEAAVASHGSHRWSAVASELLPRTDNQCWRRWKHLHPELLLAFQKDNKIQRAALISNFVGRKRERSKLRPSDFIPEPGAFGTIQEDCKKDDSTTTEVGRFCGDEASNPSPSAELDLHFVTLESSKRRRLERLQKRREARASRKLLLRNQPAKSLNHCSEKHKKPSGHAKETNGKRVNEKLRCNPAKNGTRAFVKFVQGLANACKRMPSGLGSAFSPLSAGNTCHEHELRALESSLTLDVNLSSKEAPEAVGKDEEVETAVKAVLSWPFMWKMQGFWGNVLWQS